MKLATLQGIEAQATMQGFSRVTPAVDSSVNGFSRVNYMNNIEQLQGLMLSGLMLSGHKLDPETREDFDTYLEECIAYQMEPSSQGFGEYMMQGRAQRRARREARRARRQKRRQAKATRKEQRGRRREARTLRQERGEGFFQKIGEGVKGLAQRAGGMLEEGAEGFMDDFGGTMLPEVEITPGGGVSTRGYMIGKPPFEPWTGKWWGAKRVPMWQKVAVGAGAFVLVDQVALKGKFTNPLIGKKPRTKKR